MRIVKIIFVAALIGAAFLVLPGKSSAQNQIESELLIRIQSLLQQVEQLKARLSQSSGSGGQAPTWCHTFNTNLSIGSSGDEVSALTTTLFKEGVLSERSSNFSTTFDEILASAVTGFQEKYKGEILTPNGLRYGTGFVGKSTRAKLNAIYGCNVVVGGGGGSTSSTTGGKAMIGIYSPAAGDQWKVGQTYSISWDSYAGLPRGSGVSPAPGSVKISLIPYTTKCSPDSTEKCILYGDAPHYIISSLTENDGSFEWQVSSESFVGQWQVKIENLTWGVQGVSDAFNIVPALSTNQLPVIRSISGPASLKVGEIGTWTISAYDPDGNYLSYSVDWGDASGIQGMAPISKDVISPQTATFSHSYSQAGNYSVVFVVTDSNGGSAKSSLTLVVGDQQASLVVSRSGASPASANIPAGAVNVELARIKLTAMNSANNVAVTRMDVGRETIGSCSLRNIKLIDGSSGVQLGATVPWLNSNCTAVFDGLNFSILSIPGGYSKEVAIRADAPTVIEKSESFATGIVGLSCPLTCPGGISGIPAYGNTMTFVASSFSSPLTVTAIPLVPTDYKYPTALLGSSAITLGRFTFAAGQNEDIKITDIDLTDWSSTNNATASLQNLMFLDEIGMSLNPGTSLSLNYQTTMFRSTIHFSVPIMIARGTSRMLTLRGDAPASLPALLGTTHTFGIQNKTGVGGIVAVSSASNQTLTDAQIAGTFPVKSSPITITTGTVVGCSTSISCYDYNKDGVLNDDDVGVLMFVVNNLQKCPDGFVCDINGDGALNILDITKLQSMFSSTAPNSVSATDGMNSAQMASALFSAKLILEQISKLLVGM